VKNDCTSETRTTLENRTRLENYSSSILLKIEKNLSVFGKKPIYENWKKETENQVIFYLSLDFP
jgi:hypothetical protein